MVVDELEPKDFASFVNTKLLGPASSPSLQNMLAPGFDQHIKALKDVIPDLSKSATEIETKVTPIKEKPQDLPGLLNAIRQLNEVLDRERALREKVNDSAAVTHLQLVIAARQSATDPQFQPLANIVERTDSDKGPQYSMTKTVDLLTAVQISGLTERWKAKGGGR